MTLAGSTTHADAVTVPNGCTVVECLCSEPPAPLSDTDLSIIGRIYSAIQAKPTEELGRGTGTELPAVGNIKRDVLSLLGTICSFKAAIREIKSEAMRDEAKLNSRIRQLEREIDAINCRATNRERQLNEEHEEKQHANATANYAKGYAEGAKASLWRKIASIFGMTPPDTI